MAQRPGTIEGMDLEEIMAIPSTEWDLTFEDGSYRMTNRESGERAAFTADAFGAHSLQAFADERNANFYWDTSDETFGEWINLADRPLPAPPQTLKIQVYLCSTYSRLRHGPATPVRLVEVPILQAPTIEHALNAAFHHGQNEIHAQNLPSVSCGDVVVIETDEGPQFHRVRSCGFERVQADRPDYLRGMAAADLGSFGKLMGGEELELDLLTRDYAPETSPHANSRHYSEASLTPRAR